MTIYDDMQGIATDVLTEFTQSTDATPIMLVQVVPGNGPAENPGPPTTVETRIPGATARGSTFKYVNMGLMLKTDMLVVSQVMPVNGEIGGKLRVNGKLLKIVDKLPKPASGPTVAIHYICRS